MKYTEIMVRYGELSTKGKNRKRFIQQLAKNIRLALVDFPKIKIIAERDRTHLLLNGEDSDLLIPELKKVFGIQSFSPVVRVEKDLEEMKKMAVSIVREQFFEGMTFKITSKRSDHDFELDTTGLNQFLGSAVFNKVEGIQAKMKKPDLDLRVEVRMDAVYFSFETIKGAGGLPVATSGRGMLMLSGGIDSPVAGYLAMKRGVELEMVHFASPPYTSAGALQKAKDLTQKLTVFGGNIQFIEVPFTEIQEEIKAKAPEAYLMTITRRMMMRLTDKIRQMRKGYVIINGESLGQVASQTLESMQAINDVTTTPVIRPVVTMDKLEIIELSQKIDTFEISIQPFEDCCTIFSPASPKTRPNLELTREYEARLDIEGLIERAIAGLKISEITPLGEVGNVRLEDEFEDLL
ncbi:thiamine biosynthesis protein ThiI [Pilibacter termitis]|uniref:Probable tRNA sulfurtransferase n=1 Tax=Pilibacter termitis TaxID=263852 RepID=A0A1T4LYQ7_9ENTE|nr:tRNA uracil 4-sulfurtransferase ThiI [Pilibacter termitis]SJZ59668.1 thiamine biosynthesis protein ThiI [Pilibacter termitis]